MKIINLILIYYAIVTGLNKEKLISVYFQSTHHKQKSDLLSSLQVRPFKPGVVVIVTYFSGVWTDPEPAGWSRILLYLQSLQLRLLTVPQRLHDLIFLL